MKTFFMKDDNNRIFTKSSIHENEFDKYVYLKKKLLGIDKVSMLKEKETPEGPYVNIRYDEMNFDLILDEIYGLFIYIDDSKNVKLIQNLVENI